jgi:serine/threonine protein kinase
MAQRLFLQLLDAVAHCHAMKVCHRDLKLENFVLDKNQASGCNHRRTRLQPHGSTRPQPHGSTRLQPSLRACRQPY